MGSGNDSSQPIHAKEFGQGWSQIEADYEEHHNIFMYTYMEVCQKSIVINSNGMNNQLFWGSRAARVLTHNHICMYIYNIYIYNTYKGKWFSSETSQYARLGVFVEPVFKQVNK